MATVNLNSSGDNNYRPTLENIRPTKSQYAVDFINDIAVCDDAPNEKMMKESLDYQFKRATATGYYYHKDAAYFKSFRILFTLITLVISASVTLILGISKVVAGELHNAPFIIALVGSFITSVAAAVNLAYDPKENQRDNEEAGDKYTKIANRIKQAVQITSDQIKLSMLISFVTRKLNDYDKRYDHIDDDVVNEKIKKINGVFDEKKMDQQMQRVNNLV